MRYGSGNLLQTGPIAQRVGDEVRHDLAQARFRALHQGGADRSVQAEERDATLWGANPGVGLAHTFNGALALIVTVLAFILCLQAALPLLSFIPGAFVGTAVFFGTSFNLGGTVLALVIGACLGYVSSLVAAKIQATVDGPGAATPQTASA